MVSISPATKGKKRKKKKKRNPRSSFTERKLVTSTNTGTVTSLPAGGIFVSVIHVGIGHFIPSFFTDWYGARACTPPRRQQLHARKLHLRFNIGTAINSTKARTYLGCWPTPAKGVASLPNIHARYRPSFKRLEWIFASFPPRKLKDEILAYRWNCETLRVSRLCSVASKV